MRLASLGVTAAIVFAACGGTTIDVDGGVDSGGNDSVATDSPAQDVVEFDAAECVPPGDTCATPCPSGTVCLRVSGPQPTDLGCTTIPKACNGAGTCDCMKACFCNQGIDKCMAQQDGSLLCDNGKISKRAFKTDIEYVANDERADLARETLAIPLATYRYKTESAGAKRHLGFIIDDQPATSPAVAGDQTHVDEYGYASMLLATVQEQQKQIDALRKEVEALKRSR